MSDDLSRVKSRQKKYKGEGQAPVKGKNRKQAAVSPPKRRKRLFLCPVRCQGRPGIPAPQLKPP